MRIMHLSEYLLNGGLETHILCLCKRLISEGHQPSIFAMKMSHEFKKQAEELGIETLSDPAPGRKIKNFIRQKGIQLLHCHPDKTIRLGAALKKEFNLPLVATYHGFYGWNTDLHPLIDKIVCVSQEVYDKIAAIDPSSVSKLVSIPNGVDTEVFSPTWRKPKKGWKILFIGRLDMEKYISLKTIIEALHSVPKVELLVAGSGPYQKKLKAQAPPWVKFLGYIQDVSSYINKVNLVIATGRGIREALSCGKPAISLDNGMYDGLVTPETVEAFAYHNFMGRSGQTLTKKRFLKDVEKLFGDIRLRSRLCQWGRRYALKHFSAEPFYRKHIELYQELIDSTPPAVTSPPVRKRPVICFAAIDWDFLYQRPHQLMRRLAAGGHPVYFREARQIPGSKLKEVAPNLWVCRDMNKIPENDREHAIYFVYLPKYSALISPSKNKFVVYDCVDDFPEFSQTEENMFKLADLTICSSSRLMVKHQNRHPEMIFVPNGADVDHFSPDGGYANSKPLNRTAKAVIGFSGAMYPGWVDVRLLYHIASARPEWQVVVLGHTYKWDFSDAPPNLIRIDRQPIDKLSGYLQQFDVGLIPFLDNQISQGSDPIKLYEYLAAGLPVVSSNLPFIRNLRPPLVYPYNSEEECLAVIEKALQDDAVNRDENLRQRVEFAHSNTWDDRVESILSAISELTWIE